MPPEGACTAWGAVNRKQQKKIPVAESHMCVCVCMCGAWCSTGACKATSIVGTRETGRGSGLWLLGRKNRGGPIVQGWLNWGGGGPPLPGIKTLWGGKGGCQASFVGGVHTACWPLLRAGAAGTWVGGRRNIVGLLGVGAWQQLEMAWIALVQLWRSCVAGAHHCMPMASSTSAAVSS